MVKLRGKLRSVLALAMAVILLVTMAMPTLAAGTASVGSVAGDINGGTIIGQDADQGKQTEYKNDIYVGNTPIEETCDVYATVPNSGIVVTVPKVQILDGKAGASNSGVYKVEVRGDISADTVITVSPLDEMADRDGVNFEMSSDGKDNIPTDVEQERTAFTYADGVRPDSPATTTGVITAYGMTAGIWNGDFQFNIGASTRPLNTDELDERYEMLYYSALHKAVTDVNNNAVGENVDVPKDQAVAAVYTDENGGTNVVLLKDSTEDVTTSPAKDMTINLAGNTLKVNDAYAINITGGDVTIDGRTEGSSIELNYNGPDDKNVMVVANEAGDSFTVLGGTYKADYSSTKATPYTFWVGAKNATIDGATISSNNNLKHAYGIGVSGDVANISISNCDIDVKGASYAYGIRTTSAESNLSISNCDVNVDSSFVSTSNVVASFGLRLTCNAEISNTQVVATGTVSYGSIGIAAESGTGKTLTLNNCHVKGLHSGVQANGTTYVNGGTYEGYAHGGFYFSGPDTVKYIENATSKQCEWFGEYTKPSGNINLFHNSGFYVGGSTGQDNIKVYMNNCDIWAKANGFVLRGSNGEKDNSVYISNSRIHSLNSQYNGEKGNLTIRIDDADPAHKLFIGRGCNFTASDVNSSYGIITETNDVYVK